MVPFLSNCALSGCASDLKHLIRMVHIVGAHFHWDTYTNLSKSSHLQELSVNTESQVHSTSLLGMGYKCGEMLRCDR